MKKAMVMFVNNLPDKSINQSIAEFGLHFNPSCGIDNRSDTFMTNLMFTLIDNKKDMHRLF